MALPTIVEREEFKRRICSWCAVDCPDRDRWQTVEHSRQIICLDFEMKKESA